MSIQVERYAVRVYGGPSGDGQHRTAQIHLFGGDNKWVGTLDFYAEGAAFPRDAIINETIVLSFGEKMLSSIVDLLRNEHPIYLKWNKKTENGFISTSQEPVGANDEDKRGV